MKRINIVKSSTSTLHFERSEREFNVFYIVYMSAVIGTINVYRDSPKPSFYVHRGEPNAQVVTHIMNSIPALKKACDQY